MDAIVIHSLNAMLYASILFLIAGGLSLIYGVMRIVNLAHGNLFALGAFVTASVVGQWLAGAPTAVLYLLVPSGAFAVAPAGADAASDVLSPRRGIPAAGGLRALVDPRGSHTACLGSLPAFGERAFRE